MRRVLLAVLGSLALVSSGSALPQRRTGHAPSSQNDQIPALPACTVETVQLGSLKDGAAVASTLSSVFPEFVVVPDSKQSKTLYVVDRSAARDPQDCKKGWTSTHSHVDLDAVLDKLDHESFNSVTLDSSFVIHVPKVTAQEVVLRLPHPTPFIHLKSAADDYLVSTPVMGAPGDALTKQAAGVKHDLELLDEQYGLAKAGVDTQEARDFVGALTNLGAKQAARTVAGWIARHTVTLWRLEPRDVILALQDDFVHAGRVFRPMLRQHSIIILPADAPPSANALIAAEAVERSVLYEQERRTQEEAKASGADGKGSDSDRGDASSPATTKAKSSTTSFSPSKSAAARGISGSPSDSSPGKDSKKGAGADGNQNEGGNSNGNDNAGNDNESGTQNKDQNQSGKDASKSSAGSGQAGVVWTSRQTVRLYHLREASKIADAINKAAGKDQTLVAPIDEDLLLIRPPAPGQTDHSDAIRRAITIMDLPRPKISFQVWSYQISADKKRNRSGPSRVQEDFGAVRDAVEKANRMTRLALARAFGAVLDDARAPSGAYFDPDFSRYLTKNYKDCVNDNHYCLGYSGALLVPPRSAGDAAVDHSLSRFLLFLAAAKDGQIQQTIRHLQSAMQSVTPPSTPPAPFECLAASRSAVFPNFFEQLCIFSELSNLHKVRAAVLDFLFHYKWAMVYPDDFAPYDLQRSAHVLDSLLSPILDAFNEDLDAVVESTIQDAQRGAGNKRGANFGEVQVAVASGKQASVVGRVKNYFDITPPVSLADLLNPNSSTSQGLASALKGVLQPKEITILSALANANAQPRITAEVSKDTTLTVTPTSLDQASSADLDVEFEVKDDTAPQAVNQSAAQRDLLDRVADHHVTTHVRVDSLKLFQISAFTMELTHPQPPLCFYSPLCAVWRAIFGSIPVAGHVFEIPRGPKTKDNRSVAIVRAVIVPTAMDLGLGLRFERDRILDPVTDTATPASSIQQTGGRILPFHNRLMECFVQPKDSTQDCLTQVTLTHIHEDVP